MGGTGSATVTGLKSIQMMLGMLRSIFQTERDLVVEVGGDCRVVQTDQLFE